MRIVIERKLCCTHDNRNPERYQGREDGGVYLIRGQGKRRYVGETVSLDGRRKTELLLGRCRLVQRMTGSTKAERLIAEAALIERLRKKGFMVVTEGSGGNCRTPALVKKKSKWLKGAEQLLDDGQLTLVMSWNPPPGGNVCVLCTQPITETDLHDGALLVSSADGLDYDLAGYESQEYEGVACIDCIDKLFVAHPEWEASRGG